MQPCKKTYYEYLFEKTKNDSRKMWTAINSIISNTSGNTRTLPDTFNIEGELVSDPKIVANELNTFLFKLPKKSHQT